MGKTPGPDPTGQEKFLPLLVRIELAADPRTFLRHCHGTAQKAHDWQASPEEPAGLEATVNLPQQGNVLRLGEPGPYENPEDVGHTPDAKERGPVIQAYTCFQCR